MNILTTVITSFQAALALLFEFVPQLLGFLVILLIGWIVASALAKAVTLLLRKVGFDRIADRIGLSRLGQQAGIKTDAADILGKLVYWFIEEEHAFKAFFLTTKQGETLWQLKHLLSPMCSSKRLRHDVL